MEQTAHEGVEAEIQLSPVFAEFLQVFFFWDLDFVTMLTLLLPMMTLRVGQRQGESGRSTQNKKTREICTGL